jgi:YVTN family beta-propeller protein
VSGELEGADPANYGSNHTETYNWGGYVYCPPPNSCDTAQNPNSSGSHAIIYVQGVWQVPKVTCTQNCSDEAVAVWVGIGGINGQELMQLGTYQGWNSSSNSSAYAEAVWTMDTSPQRAFWVHPGNTIVASLTYDGWVDGMQNWAFSMTDVTDWNNWTHGEGCDVGDNCDNISEFASAEWIVEAPGTLNHPIELPAYTPVAFSDLEYAEAGSGPYFLGSSAANPDTWRFIQSYPTNGSYCANEQPQAFFCQNGVIPSQIFGSANTSTFYGQYLVDSYDMPSTCCKVNPTSASPGTLVNGTVGPLDVLSLTPFKKNTDYGSGGLTPFNLGIEMGIVEAGGASATSITVQSDPYFGTYDGSNGYIYVANSGSDSVSVINGSSTKVSPIAVGSVPIDPVYDSGNGFVYVPNSGTDTVSVIHNTSLEPGGPITVGNGPHAGAFDPTDGLIYIANSISNTVSVIAGLTVVKSVHVQSDPLFVT